MPLVSFYNPWKFRKPLVRHIISLPDIRKGFCSSYSHKSKKVLNGKSKLNEVTVLEKDMFL